MKTLDAIWSIGFFLPPLVLLLAALKLHRRKRLPALLMTGIVLVPLAIIPQTAFRAVNTEHLQAFLLKLFPEANKINSGGFSSVLIDGTPVGPVYISLMQISHMAPALAFFLFGLGFFLLGRQTARERQSPATPSVDVR
ncbi:MAG: hypothetical protein ACPG4K_08330 [Haloferula sp.]